MIPQRFVRRTRRLLLRPLRPADHEAWKRAVLAVGPPGNRFDFLAFRSLQFRKRGARGLSRTAWVRLLGKMRRSQGRESTLAFGAFLRGTGELVGLVHLMDRSRGIFQSAYVGWGVFNPHWGKGYGTEAVGAVVRIGFEDAGLHRIEAGIDPRNLRSIRLARSVGMRYEGLSRRRLFVDGGWQDMRVYALTVEDLGRRWRGRITKSEGGASPGRRRGARPRG